LTPTANQNLLMLDNVSQSGLHLLLEVPMLASNCA